LKADCSLLSELLIGRTKYKFAALQLEHGLGFVKGALQNQLQYMNPKDLSQSFEQCPVLLKDEQEGLGAFVESTVKEILEGFKKQTSLPKTDGFDCFDLADLSGNHQFIFGQENGDDESLGGRVDDQGFIDQVILFISKKYKTMKNDFGYLNANMKSLEETRCNDQYIKKKNINKNIPFEIGDIDCLFYDLDKEVNISLLEKLYEDYINFVKEQGKELKPEDPLLLNEGHNVNINNHNMELELDFGQEEFVEDLDLLNLDNLQLRRTLF